LRINGGTPAEVDRLRAATDERRFWRGSASRRV